VIAKGFQSNTVPSRGRGFRDKTRERSFSPFDGKKTTSLVGTGSTCPWSDGRHKEMREQSWLGLTI